MPRRQHSCSRNIAADSCVVHPSAEKSSVHFPCYPIDAFSDIGTVHWVTRNKAEVLLNSVVWAQVALAPRKLREFWKSVFIEIAFWKLNGLIDNNTAVKSA